MKFSDNAASFLVNHPVLCFFLFSALTLTLAVLHDSSRETHLQERVKTIQMNDNVTCFVLDDSISCVQLK